MKWPRKRREFRGITATIHAAQRTELRSEAFDATDPDEPAELCARHRFPHPDHNHNRTSNSEAVRRLYAGPVGAALRTLSHLSLHVPLSKQWLRDRIFDLRGARRILDAGCGAGQLTRHLAQYADPDASITACDFSAEMLLRARQQLPDFAIQFVLGDLTQLPFADASFDCVTCGYALEHLSDARYGLAELARVLSVGGRLLLLTTEDRWTGRLTARMWNCRAYNREKFRYCCHEQGLIWKRELWYSSVHQLLGMGGICVEIERQRVASDEPADGMHSFGPVSASSAILCSDRSPDRAPDVVAAFEPAVISNPARRRPL